MLLRVAATVVLFLFALQLLGAATDAVRPLLRRVLGRVVVGDRSALGLSWVASYVLANGSLVAALSLSLFSAELIRPTQLYLMVVGSRLGGAGVVVFIGAFDYVNEELDSLREATRLGLLTVLLTHSIYLPAMVLGYGVIPELEPVFADERALPQVGGVPDLFLGAPDAVVGLVGAGPAAVVAFGCLVASLRLFDSALDTVDTDWLRRRYITELQDTWLSFGLGVLATGLTTSVAFSLGVVVPLYNRGHVKRREILPFVLGANVGTLTDTLLVAVALDTPLGAAAVVVLLVLGFGISVLLLLSLRRYQRVIGGVQDAILASRRYFVAFLLVLLLVPLALLVV